MKKILIFIIILIILFGLYLVYNYFSQPVVQAPANLEIPQNNGFRGPSGAPFIKGPTGPPPSQ